MTGIDVPEAGDFSHEIEYAVQDGRRRAVVRVRGDLDITTVGRLRAVLTDLLIEGVSPVVVDLTELAFLDSSGLGALLAAHKRARVFQAGFVLVVTTGPVQQLLAITGLNRVFRISATVEQAFADLDD